MEVLIPSTFGGEERDRKIFAFKVGVLARAISIFGIEEITIYKEKDPKLDEKKNAKLIEKFLRYIEVPPYLRKDIIPFDPDLKEANILPALQIPAHGYSERFREGIVLKSGIPSIVKAGLKENIKIPKKLKEGSRVTLEKIGSNYRPVENPEHFWTFKIENSSKDLKELLERKRKENKIVIGTSKYGENYEKIREELKKKLEKFGLKNVVVVFGSAWRGIYKIMENCGINRNKAVSFFDFMVNFVPEQRTKTVRTEEALLIVLGILNSLR